MTKRHFTVYLEKPMWSWIEKEAERDGRSITKQIEHFIKEQKAIREDNFKTMGDKAKNEAIRRQS